MFKFDKNTVPYHISNLVFYVLTLVAVGLIYYFAFLPPLLEVTSDEFFANFGLRQAGGTAFFLVLIIVPILLLFGIVYHLFRLIKPVDKTATNN